MLEPTRLPDADWARISGLIPGPDPTLAACPDGPRAGAQYPVCETSLAGNEREYLNACIDSNWISSRGRFVERFEAAFAREIGVDCAVACANGTVALHLALTALGIGPDDEVIVPSFAMIAVASAVRYTGAAVVPVDSEPRFFNLDPAKVEEAITPRTRAVIVVHTYGHPARLDRLNAIARRRGLKLIEDAAEAHGAEFDGKRVGSLSDVSTFSFYANKIVTTGEGGMVCTPNAGLAEVVRRLRDHAFSPERHFWHEYVGFNYRMTNLQAAIGVAQMERFAELVAARRRLARWYGEALDDVAGLTLPCEDPRCRSVYWMYWLRVEPGFGCTRDELRAGLAARGVETRTFFIPIHFQPAYFGCGGDRSFPVAEALCKTGLYLPTSANLNAADAAWIANQVKAVQAEAGVARLARARRASVAARP